MKPTCLIIAGADINAKNSNEPILEKLKSAFDSDCVIQCNTLHDLDMFCNDCSEVRALLYFDSFPSSYEAVLTRAKLSPNITHIYKATLDYGRIWLYEKEMLVGCVSEEELPTAIKSSIKIKDWFDYVASPITVAIGVLLLIAISMFVPDRQNVAKDNSNTQTAKIEVDNIAL